MRMLSNVRFFLVMTLKIVSPQFFIFYFFYKYLELKLVLFEDTRQALLRHLGNDIFIVKYIIFIYQARLTHGFQILTFRCALWSLQIWSWNLWQLYVVSENSFIMIAVIIVIVIMMMTSKRAPLLGREMNYTLSSNNTLRTSWFSMTHLSSQGEWCHVQALALNRIVEDKWVWLNLESLHSFRRRLSALTVVSARLGDLLDFNTFV